MQSPTMTSRISTAHHSLAIFNGTSSSPRSARKRSQFFRGDCRQFSAQFVKNGTAAVQRRRGKVVCGLGDFVGGDLLGLDLGKWVSDVETYGCIAVYPPPEGGYEGRYATRLKMEGYHFMNISARGLGDPEAYLTKVHGVRPPHLGKQAIVRWYFPPQVDYRLSLLPKNSKGLVLWVLEAKVLSKTELQYLALLPAYRPDVKVIAECGSWRSFRWKPLKEVAGLPMTSETKAVKAPPVPERPKVVSEEKKEKESPVAVGS